MAISFHPEAKKIKETLDRYGIKKLYHFTSIDNLPIITECSGLWSKERLEQAGLLNRVITGGNELSLSLDRELGNWDKVHLYFCPNTPMAYRVQQNPEGRNPQSAHICYLIVDQIATLWDGVYFTDTNATRTTDGHQQEQGLAGLKLVDFNTIKSTLLTGPKPWDQVWHRNVQAECLVPDEVPLKYIKGISFISEASLKEGERLWKFEYHPPFNVDEHLFPCDFIPYVKNAILTSKEVNKDNVDSENFSNMQEFIIGRDPRITMLVYLKATPGLQTETIWRNSNDEEIYRDKIMFEKESNYWHWPNIGIERLNIGHWSVEYFIRETRWIKIHFTIRR